MLRGALAHWSEADPKPLVLLIDETDALSLANEWTAPSVPILVAYPLQYGHLFQSPFAAVHSLLSIQTTSYLALGLGSTRQNTSHVATEGFLRSEISIPRQLWKMRKNAVNIIAVTVKKYSTFKILIEIFSGAT